MGREFESLKRHQPSQLIEQREISEKAVPPKLRRSEGGQLPATARQANPSLLIKQCEIGEKPVPPKLRRSEGGQLPATARLAKGLNLFRPSLHFIQKSDGIIALNRS